MSIYKEEITMKKKITALLIGTCFTAALMSGCGQRIDGTQQTQGQSGTQQTQGQSGTSAQNNTSGTQNSSAGTSQNFNNGVTQNSNNGGTQASGTGITEADAKTIALNQAGVAEADTIGLAVRQDFDDGLTIYEVDIYTPSMDYDYDINAADGTILKEDRSVTEQVTTDPGTAITPAKAKEILLAKVSGAGEQNLRMKVDFDDGRSYYEGEIIYNGMSYDYELDAQTGNIVEWSEEVLGF